MPYLRRTLIRSKPESTPIQPETARAIDGIVRAYEAYIQRVLLQRGVHPRDADDELQQIWERLTRNAPRLSGDLRTWLLAVAINRSGNYHQERRMRERRLVSGLERHFLDRNPDAEEAVIGAEIAHLVDDLDPKLRAVTMGSIAGETTQEIAERLRIPAGTVMSRLRRARVQIKAALERDSAFRRSCRRQGRAIF